MSLYNFIIIVFTEEAQMKEGTGSLPHNMSSDTVRASEYEHLAKLCLDRGQ